MVNIKESIHKIDDAFSAYLIDNNKDFLERDLMACLNAFAAPSKKFKVSVIEPGNRPKEPFYGMRAFIDFEYADSLLSAMVSTQRPVSFKEICSRWRSIDKWEIEIDGRILDRDIIAFNPQELTAMLLHEVGHTVYSDRPMEMFYRAYKECDARLKSADKAALQVMYSLYLIPLTIACGIRNWTVSDKDLREEIFADQSVGKLGYGEYLISAYSKIIKRCGSGGYRSKNWELDEIENSVAFCNVNIADLRHRREKLRDELYHTASSHNSNYIRNMVTKLMNMLGVMKKDRYSGSIVTESGITVEDYVNEGFLTTTELIFDYKKFDKLENTIKVLQDHAERDIATEAFGKKKNMVPSQLDVDLIMVEVDRIQNHADRRYVLDLIYAQEEKIERFLETCKYDKDLNKKHYNHMQAMLRELAECRSAVLQKRNFDKQYKVFVKYPAGYEG